MPIYLTLLDGCLFAAHRYTLRGSRECNYTLDLWDLYRIHQCYQCNNLRISVHFNKRFYVAVGHLRAHILVR